MTEKTDPQPAEGLRQYLAEAMAKEAGSKAFMEPGTAWDHARSKWLAHADAAVNALHRWEQEGTLARLCVIPGCFQQLNIVQGEPGWLQSSAVGYMCPDHAPILWAGPDGPHVPRWGYADPDAAQPKALLRCSCGWDAGKTRFRGHGTALWQAHALKVLEAAR
ncbi:hypothetical protein [Streptomyces sp. NPDC059970]|uniref:hypothetical protein n=1 Tax=Streptomyces sp. NPDC059970 TaxID=3347019 RepID=UPI00369FB281